MGKVVKIGVLVWASSITCPKISHVLVNVPYLKR